MQHSRWIALGVAAAMLGACTEADGSPGRGVMQGGAPSKQEIGTVAGVIGGGVIGSTIGGGAGKVAATIGGALLGGMLGSTVGKSLDNADRASYDNASQAALDSGQVRRWSNADTGHSGTITPGTRYTDDSGRTCREYSQTIMVEGKAHTGHGVACRASDGSWRIVS